MKQNDEPFDVITDLLALSDSQSLQRRASYGIVLPILRKILSMRFYGLFLATVLISSSLGTHAQQASINWMTLEEALAAQEHGPRKIMMDVYTSWCGPCKMMMANTFTNPDVIAYLNRNYYAVKFDAESPDAVNYKGQVFENPGYREGARGRNSAHQLSRALQVNAYPTLVFLKENGDVLAPISGYKTPKQIERFLRYFEEAWKLGTKEEWDQFQEAFIPTFGV